MKLVYVCQCVNDKSSYITEYNADIHNLKKQSIEIFILVYSVKF